ncbi:MAG: sigma-70 family RNA polymerase sigma factor [Firmicutes bacterium]|nr:sigma-70 family RNA polymerase sigma factor [Bacillota bacterium]
MGPLSHEETLELIARASRGDLSARESLVEANAGLVRAIAARFRCYAGNEYEDIVQVAYVGFLKAIDGFDPGFGVRFSTYAFPVIMGEIRRYLRDTALVHLSRSVQEARSRVSDARAALNVRLGREPTVAEIAAEAGLEPDQVIEAIESARPPQWLDGPAGGDESPAMLDVAGSPDESEGLIDRLALGKALDSLEPRERLLIILRYVKGYTQTGVAARLGVSQAQVSREEKRALERLRQLMTG